MVPHLAVFFWTMVLMMQQKNVATHSHTHVSAQFLGPGGFPTLCCVCLCCETQNRDSGYGRWLTLRLNGYGVWLVVRSQGSSLLQLTQGEYLVHHDCDFHMALDRGYHRNVLAILWHHCSHGRCSEVNNVSQIVYFWQTQIFGVSRSGENTFWLQWSFHF